MATRKSELSDILPEGMKVDSIIFKSPEDPEDKAARLRREFWSFVVREIAAYAVGFLFLILIAAYCCFVVARHGVISPEAHAVFPLLTTLFGGVLGMIVGKAGK